MIQYLDKVKSAGSNAKGTHYRAACPVHNGKDRNLLVTERQDGSWFCHCFVCNADTKEVKDVLGIPWGEIDPKYLKPSKGDRPRYKNGEDQRLTDLSLIQEYDKNGPMVHTDIEAYERAKGRMRDFNNKMEDWMNG